MKRTTVSKFKFGELVFIGLFLAAFSLFNCFGDDGKSTGTVADTPAFNIDSPTEGASLGNTVLLKLKTLHITYKVDTTKVEGQGHFHVFLDVSPNPARSNYTHMVTVGDTVTLGGLGAGPHSVIVSFHYADHSYSGLSDNVNFTVAVSAKESFNIGD